MNSVFNNLSAFKNGCCALLLVIAIVFFPNPSWAQAPTLEEISQQLRLNEDLHGEFVQRKYLSILPSPLQSRGNFAFHPDSGLVWETQQPLQSKLTFSAQGISQEQHGQQTWLARADQPGVAVIGQILTAMLTRDWETLTNYFSIEVVADSSAAQWHLLLTPTQATLSTVIQRIALSGDQHVRQMILFEQNNDRTEIDFTTAQ